MSLTTALVVAAAGILGCSEAEGGRDERVALAAQPGDTTRLASRPELPPLTEEEREMYRDLAASAWQYLEANYQSATGWVNGTPDWPHTTAWDIGGQLLATFAAKELGLIEPEAYEVRTRRALQSLERAQLYRGAALNKLYSTRDGSMGTQRAGWSATDLGRLFVALRVLSVREPRFAEQAERIVRRHDGRQIVKDGYMIGQMPGSKGQPWNFQEGRIGYEQYAAYGFDQWGFNVRNALELRRNASPVSVMGVELLQDTRKLDRLLSEPFILSEIEFGLDAGMRDLATRVLGVQEARFRSTGQVTIVSEDAVAIAPHYFYYYCVYCNGKPFVVDVSSPGKELDSPRWVSTKGAFGWHAIMPSEYTARAVEYVKGANDSRRGWASGVFEGSGKSTETWDVNTAAVLLEIAYYQLRGRKPMIQN
jgi:hypothetical protein